MNKKLQHGRTGLRLVACAWLLLAFAVAGLAQTESARLQGTITDQNGAAVPGATAP